jgi:hypothetical protein
MRRRKQTNPDIVWGAVAIAEACGKEVDPDNPRKARSPRSAAYLRVAASVCASVSAEEPRREKRPPLG